MAMALSIAKSTPPAQLKTKTQRLLDFASRQLFGVFLSRFLWFGYCLVSHRSGSFQDVISVNPFTSSSTYLLMSCGNIHVSVGWVAQLGQSPFVCVFWSGFSFIATLFLDTWTPYGMAHEYCHYGARHHQRCLIINQWNSSSHTRIWKFASL